MATYAFNGFSLASIVIAPGDSGSSVGDRFSIDPYWDASEDAYTFTITDDDLRYDGAGVDGGQTAVVTDALGNTVASGTTYLGERYSLSDGNGNTTTAYTVYVDGNLVGAIFTNSITPGVTWEITAAATVTASNEPAYSNIYDQNYDPSGANTEDDGGYDDTLAGGDGSDVLDLSNGGNNAAYGGSGNDTIYGGGGSDTIYGEIGADEIWGDAGNDSIDGGTGNDLLGGDGGSDTILGDVGDDTIWGGGGGDSIEGGTGNDLIGGDGGADTISGGDGWDEIWAGNGNDSISGDGGADTISGEGGNDTISGGSEADSLLGNAGNDVISGDGGDDTISGGNDDDSLTGGDGNDQIDGGAGRDTIYGDTGNDYLEGGDDDDLIYFGTGTDTVLGGGGNDTIDDIADDNSANYANLLSGDDGNDLIYAGAGDDTVVGGYGNDTLFAEGGDDSIYSGEGDDYIDGGDDNDYIMFGLGADTIYGGSGNDTILDATSYGDNVYANWIDAGDGNDSIRSGSGDDTVDGGAGNDTIVGERGNDLLTGGTGYDRFWFFDESGNDTITDFDMGDDDSDGYTNDQLDLTDLSNLSYSQVTLTDVVTSDDGFGNAVLTFPWGESITLNGVAPTQADDSNELYSMGVPCYVSGTRIQTPGGEVLIENLRAGDLVSTLGHGPQPILWAGRRHLGPAELEAQPHLKPIRLRDGVLGNCGDLLVSPQHGMMLPGDAQSADSLVRAVHLERDCDGRVRRAKGRRQVTYHHLLLPMHAVIFANGAAGESLFPGRFALHGFDDPARAELFSLFPRLADILTQDSPTRVYGPMVLPFRSAAMLPMPLAPLLPPSPTLLRATA